MEGNEGSVADIKFKGKELSIPEIGTLWLPTANIELITESTNYLCEMLVDSGADITLIPRSLGEFLGFSFTGEHIHEIRGIGEGTIPYIIKPISVKIGEYKLDVNIGIALIEEVPLILGRLGVFDKFNIEFKQSSRMTVFRISA